jgi:glucose-6-phosphate dehydrogenase assembly protein OpcA
METAMTAIKPDSILHELTELWTSLSTQETGHPDGSGGVLRACAMTLIVFVDDESDSMALGETLAELMRAHPSRAIVVRLREDDGILESRVFAQCWMPFGQRRQICCEQVEISAALNRVADIPVIVGPLAAPDVPRVVWFRSSRIESVPDLGDLLALGDKMIVDSARPGAPTFADLRALANAGYIVGDLAWTRITKLRQLIAQLLGGRDLSGIRKVTIEYSGKEAAPEVKYLQAWLRSTLNPAKSMSQAVDVDLRRSDSADKAGIAAIHIDPDIQIRVEKNCAEYECGSLRQRANIPEASESDLLDEELNIMIHDRIFERALQRMSVWAPRS